ncbi:MAG TPA: NIPSNAP family protein, partial [Thermoanaerobaculia bacterium]|nr:NIPSNAP family protein [Thermoanaerobaculia bacterium]
MQIELRIFEVEAGMRCNALEHLATLPALGRYLSFRDDKTFAAFYDSGTDVDRMIASAPLPIEQRAVRRLVPAAGSTITDVAGFAKIDTPVLEIRQYRIARGQRARFATFFHDRTLEAQTACGIRVFGQFDDLDDETNFVWMRGFPDLFAREQSKAAFYQSALWLNDLEAEAFSMIE